MIEYTTMTINNIETCFDSRITPEEALHYVEHAKQSGKERELKSLRIDLLDGANEVNIEYNAMQEPVRFTRLRRITG